MMKAVPGLPANHVLERPAGRRHANTACAKGASLSFHNTNDLAKIHVWITCLYILDLAWAATDTDMLPAVGFALKKTQVPDQSAPGLPGDRDPSLLSLLLYDRYA